MKKLLLLALFSALIYAQNIRADVTAVKATKKGDAYYFSVTLNSTETGCSQYANWWEVLSKDGKLLYRRILIHSHPDTQPFTRSGGAVKIKEDEIVYIRAHMNSVGYVGDIFVGSVKNGFKKLDKNITFPKNIESQKPLPDGCLF